MLLIIDQPEDDLDNTIVYEGLVKNLWNLKGKRQIIFATHNANIPVLGDADQIIVLHSPENGKILLHCKGSVDDYAVKQSVMEIMEGGKEAFRKREEKYGQIETI